MPVTNITGIAEVVAEMQASTKVEERDANKRPIGWKWINHSHEIVATATLDYAEFHFYPKNADRVLCFITREAGLIAQKLEL